MKHISIVSVLLVLLFCAGISLKADAAPGHYGRRWHSGEYGWHSFNHSTFLGRHNWRNRDNRVGVSAKPGRFYRPWSAKRREFHNSEDVFSHRYYR